MIRILTRLLRIPMRIAFNVFGRKRKYFHPVKPDEENSGYAMQDNYDCGTIAMLNSDMCSYEDADRAMLKLKVGWLENPLYENCFNFEEAIRELGFIPENVRPYDVGINDSAIMLIHSCPFSESPFRHIFHQHYVAHAKGLDYHWWHDGSGNVVYFSDERLESQWKCMLYSRCWKISAENKDKGESNNEKI